MTEDRTAETVYYWVSALATALTAGFVIWRVYLTDADRQLAARKLRSLWAPLRRIRTTRNAQTELTWEVFLVLDAIEEYARGRDLQDALAVAA